MKVKKCDRCGEFYLFGSDRSIYLIGSNGIDAKTLIYVQTVMKN